MPNLPPPPTDAERPELNLSQAKDGWWIVDLEHDGAYGPYDRRKEAEEDLRGLDRFYYAWHRLKDLPGPIDTDTSNAALAGWRAKPYTTDTPSGQ